MELDWSEQSPHIRSLYRPWQPGDGYEEAEIAAAEARLGLRLPVTLRNFYRAWGQRRALTQLSDPMLSPDELVIKAETLIFWVENQAVYYWGVPLEALEEANPPVAITTSGPKGWDVESQLHWRPSHPHVSSFLDDMIYRNAFNTNGAIHGGWTLLNPPALPAHHIAWLEENWSKASIVSPLVFGYAADETIDLPPLYVRDGQAFYSFGWCCLAAREAKVVTEITQRFQLTWAKRW